LAVIRTNVLTLTLHHQMFVITSSNNNQISLTDVLESQQYVLGKSFSLVPLPLLFNSIFLMS